MRRWASRTRSGRCGRRRVGVGAFLDGCDAVVSAVPYGYGMIVAGAAVDDRVPLPRLRRQPVGGGPATRSSTRTPGRPGSRWCPTAAWHPDSPTSSRSAAVDRLGEGPIDIVGLRVGGLPIDPEGTLEYQLAFSPGGLINEYAEPCEVLRDGAYATREPLTGFEEVDWEGWGPLEAFHTAGGSSSLPRIFEGRVRHLDYKTLRYPGHGRIFRAMLELGLFEEEPGRCRRVSRWLPRAMLLERLAATLPERDARCRSWCGHGPRPNGTAARWPPATRWSTATTATYSAMARTTAYPTTALAHLLATGAIDTIGAATMDASVHADDLVPELADTGIVIEDWAPHARLRRARSDLEESVSIRSAAAQAVV